MTVRGSTRPRMMPWRVAGTLRYRVDALGIEVDLAAGRPDIVVPELPHSVQPIGAVRFSVEFLRASDGGP